MTGETESEPSAARANEAATPPRLGTLILLTALSVLPVNMILPSLPEIASAFDADAALVNLTVAAYAALTALAEIVGGALSDRYGRRPVVLAALSAFVLASLGCAMANDIYVFLLFRTLQASIATCFSIALVIIKETSGGHKAASKFGYLAMGWAIAPMIGPTIGGSVEELFGWRANFVLLAVFGIAALALAISEIKESTADPSRRRPAYFSSYRQLLSSQRFWLYALCMACSMGTLYVFLGGAPLVAGEALGGSSARLGLCMGMVPAGFILGSYLAGRYASRMRIGTVLIAGRFLTCAGLLAGGALSALGVTPVVAFFGACIFIGIGNGLIMPAANAGVLSVRPDLAGTAAGLVAAMSVGGGAVIAAIAGLVLGGSASFNVLLGVLLVPASLALAAAICAATLERRVPAVI